MDKIIVIVGPTAVGKTALSLKLAKKLNGEIISGDSMQVFKGLDIGTAKVSKEEQNQVPHFLIDTKEIDEEITVIQWVAAARLKIDEIVKRGHIPIIVGGTGFYIGALLGDVVLAKNNAAKDPKIRAKWQEYANLNGEEALHQQLAQIDLEAAKVIPKGNVRRVIRALEVFELTKQPFSKQTMPEAKRYYDAQIVGLRTERQRLYQRINARVDEMIELGLEKEAFQLYQATNLKLQSGQGIGYKEWLDYFEQRNDKLATIELIKRNSRRFAKRQLTWFRHQLKGIIWYDLVTNENSIDEIIRDIENKKC
ncbi:tRNA (adenosine(37)-N6)-dimethylallyltransferase MiaA [Periweissella beninensis]|uniref:tRNA (adenosine(37)-N6)-dimethylallyltransferase MiaA n=1 Tax=Periweissella beninensis TaxID=504936 RepID=UPI0021A6CE0C|nr:tRNA (adenosine(37)-N6)-dimethylallyltransferase MiaA [Periweissella beninensis]MCT4396612.1 tRNA (adenosine(37)-N6)-dimethylallyltransferase MiaA [Periweissella beninensis]